LFLRKKKGYSYKEIMSEIPVAKSTLSNWLSSVDLSKEQRKRIYQNQVQNWLQSGLGEWNRAKRQREIAAIRVKAKNEIGTLSEREFFVAGIMLYWAEGNKVSKNVGVSNADPLFHLFMMEWFRRHLKIIEDRFQGSIHYHEGQDYRKIERFWSDLTGIPLINFRKPFCKPPGTGHRKHYLQWGVFRIRIRKSCDLLHEILGWKDGLIVNVISGKTS
jgi:transcriptional regulator with XRE-family HTH domain